MIQKDPRRRPENGPLRRFTSKEDKFTKNGKKDQGAGGKIAKNSYGFGAATGKLLKG
jgi:hypothetical protein